MKTELLKRSEAGRITDDESGVAAAGAVQAAKHSKKCLTF